jgi:hypothetical protein
MANRPSANMKNHVSPSVDHIKIIYNLDIDAMLREEMQNVTVNGRSLIRGLSDESLTDNLYRDLNGKPNGCFILCISPEYPNHMTVAYVEKNEVKYIVIYIGEDKDNNMWWGIKEEVNKNKEDYNIHWYTTLYHLIMHYCTPLKYFYLDDNCFVDKTKLFNDDGVPKVSFPITKEKVKEVCVTEKDIRRSSIEEFLHGNHKRPAPSTYGPSAAVPGGPSAAMPGGRRVKRHTRGHKKSRRTRHSKKSRRTRYSKKSRRTRRK